MPSVGMMRTTRGFGISKSIDGARVLRSGRRLWPESGEIKLRRHNDVDDWFRLLNSHGNGGRSGRGYLDCQWDQEQKLCSKPLIFIDFQQENVERKIKPLKPAFIAAAGGSRIVRSDRMFGIVYSRKRKRKFARDHDVSVEGEEEKCYNGNRIFRLRFFRRQRKEKAENVAYGADSTGKDVSEARYSVLTAYTESSCRGNDIFTGFIYTILSYMRNNPLRITRLSSFVLSEPVNGVVASYGIRFVQGRSSRQNSGICMFFSALWLMPMFYVDFSAIPLCFMHIHSMLFRRSLFQQTRLVNNINDLHSNDDRSSDSEDENCIFSSNIPYSYLSDVSACEVISTKVVHTTKKPVLLSSSIRFKSGSGKRQLRNVTSSCGVQTRRSLLRNTTGRNMPLVGVQKASRSLVPCVIRNKKSAQGSFPVALHNKRKRSGDVSSVVSSCTLKPTQNVAIPSCSANLLVFESDKCCRKGAVVKLEISDSGEWVLVVKIDDLTRYIVKAEKVMKPCSCNRCTHNITWSADNVWKVEFPNRQDWLTFKDLYKQCYDRNILHGEPIPVPGVHEVSGYVDDFDYSFCRSDSYISCNSDEVCRALAKRTANYDMDTDDEGWLDKLNIEFLAQNELHELVSEEKFELMIDAFEKGFYCSADDSLDEKDALALCLDLGRRELIEAVYNYWMKKQKQKKSPLLRVFQGHEPKRRPLFPKPPLRKRRSFKRQPSQVGRDKLPNIWREIAAERHAMELQNAKLRAEEAKKTANKSTELAVVKRQMAQKLFVNADLATYKATMAVRIAQAAEASLAASSHSRHSQDTVRCIALKGHE